MAIAQDVLDQLPASLLIWRNLVDTGKIMCEAEVLDFIRALATQTSWVAIADALNELNAAPWIRARSMVGSVDRSLAQVEDTSLEIPKSLLLHDQRVRNLYVKDGNDRMQKMRAELAAETGGSLMCAFNPGITERGKENTVV